MYTDIHAHLLPDVDDGPATLEESLRVVDLMVEEGISRIIITPHWDEKGPFGLAFEMMGMGKKPRTIEEVKERYQQLTQAARKKYPGLEFYLGSEFYYTPRGVAGLKEGRIPTLAGTRYVLVEFNLAVEYPPLKEGIRDLIHAGFLPILAHTERYECLRWRKDRMMELLKSGMYVQVNAKTLMRGLGHPRTKWAVEMLEQNWVHLLATDSHNDEFRPPVMKEPARKLEKILLGAGAGKNPGSPEDILFGNPDKLLRNLYI